MYFRLTLLKNDLGKKNQNNLVIKTTSTVHILLNEPKDLPVQILEGIGEGKKNVEDKQGYPLE